MARLGADVEDLDTLARAFTTAARRLDGSATSLTSAIAATVWHGPDAEDFRARWNRQHAPTLRELATVVAALADRVRAQANEQRLASAPGYLPASGSDGDRNDNGWADWIERHPYLKHFLPDGPKYLHSGPDSEWTPQGQGYDETRDEILTTYYDQDDSVDGEKKPDLPGVLLSIQDRTTGSETTNVLLVGKDGTGGPLHGGGVATDGDYVYVTGGDTVWVYSRDAIDAAGEGGRVSALYEYQGVRASSFATLDDGRLYVGRYRNGSEGSLYSYELGPNGTLLDGTDQPRAEDVNPGLAPWLPIDGARYEGKTPQNVQGVEVYRDGFLFTRSRGDDDPSELYYRPFDSDDARSIGELSELSQGLNVIGDKLYVTSEANAYQFDVPDAPSAIDVFDLDDFDL